MTDSEIITCVDRFINSRKYHYALMINGKWGSGKTFFVQNVLEKHLKEEKRDVNYVSLYGIKSVDEIKNLLCIQAIKDRIAKDSKKHFGKKINTESKSFDVASIMFSSFAKFGLSKVDFSDKGLEKFLELLPNYEDNVIIFDDLERCGCDINEVMGFINNFVEHSEASVILVANEEEIGKWQLDRNPELQMLVALNGSVKPDVVPGGGELLNWKIAGHDVQNQADTKVSLTIEELEERRKHIFHSNDNYFRIKEKVVGQTINYVPNLEKVLPKFIEKIEDDTLRDKVSASIDELIKIASKDGNNNLRTFQFFIEKVGLIFSTIQNHFPTLHKAIILYTFHSSIRCMSGLKIPEWDCDYGHQSFLNDSSELDMNGLFGFSFIDEYVFNNTIDAQNVNRVLERCARKAEEKGQLSNDPFQFINKWWYSEENQVELWLDEIFDNISKGVYSTSIYPEIIKNVSQMKSYGVMTKQCDKIIEGMKQYIEAVDTVKLEKFDRERFILNGESNKIYLSIMEELDSIIKEKLKISEKKKFQDALNHENWPQRLTAQDTNIIGRSFIYWLDPSEIVRKICESNNQQLYDFRVALQSYYDDRTYYQNKNDDYEHLIELGKQIGTIDTRTWGSIKNTYIQWITSDIDRYTEQIRPISNG